MLLWHILAEIGVPAESTAAVKSMHHEVYARVRIEGSMGPAFASTMGPGVKQGCSLSPTLFGVFADRLILYVTFHGCVPW